MSRQYELIVFGATGYTGQFTAEHVATHLPTDLKWAIAGRSRDKLERHAKDLQQLNPDRTPPGIETAALDDKSSLSALAKKTTLLLSLVGPYHRYGTPVVEACAQAGTHYIDATGETPWHYDMIQKFDAQAKRSGAIMIPQSGVESVPADIMAFALVAHLRKTQNVGAAEVINTIYELKSAPSGGTLDTLLTIFDTYSPKEFIRSAARWAWCPISPPQQTFKTPIMEQITGVRTVPDLGVLTDSISRSADMPMVHRSWGLIDGGKFYGKHFNFNVYMKARNIFQAFAFHIGLGLAAVMLLLAPVRALIKKFVFQPGQGIDRERAKRERAEWRAIAYPDLTESSSAQRAYGVMRFNGSMYHLTGVFLAEAAATILRDKTVAHTLGGGLLTPATLGESYIERLKKGGVVIETRTLA